jgi:hypothetical protein
MSQNIGKKLPLLCKKPTRVQFSYASWWKSEIMQEGQITAFLRGTEKSVTYFPQNDIF